MITSRYLRCLINAPTDIICSSVLLHSLISSMPVYPKKYSNDSNSSHVSNNHFTSTLQTTDLNSGMEIYSQVFTAQIFSRRLINVTSLETLSVTENNSGKKR